MSISPQSLARTRDKRSLRVPARFDDFSEIPSEVTYRNVAEALKMKSRPSTKRPSTSGAVSPDQASAVKKPPSEPIPTPVVKRRQPLIANNINTTTNTTTNSTTTSIINTSSIPNYNATNNTNAIISTTASTNNTNNTTTTTTTNTTTAPNQNNTSNTLNHNTTTTNITSSNSNLNANSNNNNNTTDTVTSSPTSNNSKNSVTGTVTNNTSSATINNAYRTNNTSHVLNYNTTTNINNTSNTLNYNNTNINRSNIGRTYIPPQKIFKNLGQGMQYGTRLLVNEPVYLPRGVGNIAPISTTFQQIVKLANQPPFLSKKAEACYAYQEQRMFSNLLSIDTILLNVVKHLDSCDRLNLRQVCKTWKRIVDSEDNWKQVRVQSTQVKCWWQFVDCILVRHRTSELIIDVDDDLDYSLASALANDRLKLKKLVLVSRTCEANNAAIEIIAELLDEEIRFENSIVWKVKVMVQDSGLAMVSLSCRGLRDKPRSAWATALCKQVGKTGLLLREINDLYEDLAMDIPYSRRSRLSNRCLTNVRFEAI